jgi:hypothetical protein
MRYVNTSGFNLEILALKHRHWRCFKAYGLKLNHIGLLFSGQITDNIYQALALWQNYLGILFQRLAHYFKFLQ